MNYLRRVKGVSMRDQIRKYKRRARNKETKPVLKIHWRRKTGNGGGTCKNDWGHACEKMYRKLKFSISEIEFNTITLLLEKCSNTNYVDHRKDNKQRKNRRKW